MAGRRPAAGFVGGKDIHLSFGPNAVLRGVDIDVPAGTTAAVIGPSGSGKSTLLRTLNRLYEPDSGDILLDGRSVLRDNPDQLRQRIGMVFQHFNLFPHRSVLDNVTLAPRKLKRLSAPTRRASSGWPSWTGSACGTRPSARPATLSGGQQQRVAIARALAMAPQVMFFDEATSALDPELVKGILAAHRRSRRRRHDDGRRHPRDGLRPVDVGRRGVHGSRQGRRIRVRRSRSSRPPRPTGLQRFLSQVL